MGEVRRAFWETNHVVPFPHTKIVLAGKILLLHENSENSPFRFLKKLFLTGVLTNEIVLSYVSGNVLKMGLWWTRVCVCGLTGRNNISDCEVWIAVRILVIGKYRPCCPSKRCCCFVGIITFARSMCMLVPDESIPLSVRSIGVQAATLCALYLILYSTTVVE
jgi:hypothetical protein